MSLLEEKLIRVRSLISELEIDAIALTTQANFAWITTGADNHVGLATEQGAAAFVVTSDRAAVLCDNIEAPRIREEEIAGLDIEVISYPWWDAIQDQRISEWVDSEDWAADIVIGERPSIESFMYPLRSVLSGQECETYRHLGKIAGRAVQETAMDIHPGMTEYEVAGILAGKLVSQGVTPHVILIASDERINNYRHPIPKNKAINKSCMIVTGARMKGLVCSLTRMVYFETPPDEIKRRHRLVCEVEAAMLAATIPGNTIGEAMQAGLDAYAAAGFAEEWMLHHQGGPTGYKPREFRATSGSGRTIIQNQPFAWNPTITGTKAEDTVLAGEPFPEVLSITEGWPNIEVNCAAGTIKRPDILVRNQ